MSNRCAICQIPKNTHKLVADHEFAAPPETPEPPQTAQAFGEELGDAMLRDIADYCGVGQPTPEQIRRAVAERNDPRNLVQGTGLQPAAPTPQEARDTPDIWPYNRLRELAASLAAVTAERDELKDENTRLEKVVAKFIVEDVQRSAGAMVDGNKELQDTLFFVDTQRMKSLREMSALESRLKEASRLMLDAAFPCRYCGAHSVEDEVSCHVCEPVRAFLAPAPTAHTDRRDE